MLKKIVCWLGFHDWTWEQVEVVDTQYDMNDNPKITIRLHGQYAKCTACGAEFDTVEGANRAAEKMSAALESPEMKEALAKLDKIWQRK